MKRDQRTIHAEDVSIAKLLVANVENDTTDDNVKAFLCGYGFPPFDTRERVTGTGRRPAAVFGFDDVSTHALRRLQQHVHTVFWKSHGDDGTRRIVKPEAISLHSS
jgi:hypothetical protein